MATKIILKVGKYLLAIILTMIGWNYAGLAVTAKDDLAVFAGMFLYFLMFSGWIWLVCNEFGLNKNK